MGIYAIVPAAGRGLRMGLQTPKQFIELGGRPLLIQTLLCLSQASFLQGLYVVVPVDFIDQTEELLQRHLQTELHIKVVEGGIQRQDSVFNALRQLPSRCSWVIIHDGVRPFVTLQLLDAVWKAAQATGAAIAALPATDTVKRVQYQRVKETIPREQVWLVQTPQVFRKDILLRAYERAQMDGWSGTDDASLVERLDIPIAVVEGNRENIKVTTLEDLHWSTWHMEKNMKEEGL